MTTWQQGYPGAPPPAGFHMPNPNQGFAYPQQPGYPQAGYPPAGYPPPSGYPDPGMPHQGFAPAMHPDYSGMHDTGYADDGGFGGDTFTDKAIRRSFIRKVYGILCCQLLVTLSIIAFSMYHKPTRAFLRRNIWTYYVGMIGAFVFLIVLACCGEVRRKFPINVILLGVFTLIEGYMLGVVSSVHEIDSVLIAIGITAAIVLALTLFAFQTKWDFTGMGSVLMVCAVVLLLFGLIAAFAHVKILSLIYASIGAVLFSFYIIYDTQLMLGGKHKYSLSPEEYIFAALNLYVDIVNLLIMIISLVGFSRD